VLSQELLKELRGIVREEFGEELEDENLFEFGNTLLSFFELLAKIYARENLKENHKPRDKIGFDSLEKRP
jgi:hypothetical protein